MKFIEMYAISNSVKVLRYQDRNKRINRLMIERRRDGKFITGENQPLDLQPSSIQKMVDKYWHTAK